MSMNDYTLRIPPPGHDPEYERIKALRNARASLYWSKILSIAGIMFIGLRLIVRIDALILLGIFPLLVSLIFQIKGKYLLEKYKE